MTNINTKQTYTTPNIALIDIKGTDIVATSVCENIACTFDCPTEGENA